MKVTPCPKSCAMNWPEFHKLLDVAIAHMIDEQDAPPSKTSLLEFMEFSNGKKLLQEAGEFAPEDKDAD